ncbi:hypothetical protein METHB2_970003 [Candidatus Methylobacter favarea]|uniref:Uncharacterized protein n=1 Tax=Candidatus Methylobacter favarea TaxID=2707345 RepID=A0A8S0WM43_9GAMM|nr:hypothetical protein METHB2_970003 [Candidatus Methylobacter favarea]
MSHFNSNNVLGTSPLAGGLSTFPNISDNTALFNSIPANLNFCQLNVD